VLHCKKLLQIAQVQAHTLVRKILVRKISKNDSPLLHPPSKISVELTFEKSLQHTATVLHRTARFQSLLGVHS